MKINCRWLKDPKTLLNIQTIWKMFVKILINTIQNAMQKYQDHDLVKPTNMNTLQVILHPHQSRIEKAKFTYASLGKPFEKQVKLLKSKEKSNLTFYKS